ncbi:UNVERIFIED_CONTAM: hypothetical protein Sradi_5290100 [Sesamum radiatum]|uniref:Reverse transcriptase n=1 Tax=Sesamum radiatum TaxID=300843 RepID=A0AAW2LQ50_SESRA
MHWKQRGKVHWLWEGNRNTSFFHNKASIRRRKNAITRIKNGDGQWLEHSKDIRNHIEAYFSDIFRSQNLLEEELEKGIEAISVQVTEQMLQEIAQAYTAEEVTVALSQMAPLKSPGPDINHYLTSKRWGKKGYMALKLDISEAYNKKEERVGRLTGVGIWKRINGWKERNLSQADKEVLIKVVVQASRRMPWDIFNFLSHISKNSVHGLQFLGAQWRGKENPLDQLATTLQIEDTWRATFKDLQAFNLAMLQKQLWGIISNSDSLLSRVLQARYFLNGQVLMATSEWNTPYTWRSVLAAQQVAWGGFR